MSAILVVLGISTIIAALTCASIQLGLLAIALYSLALLLLVLACSWLFFSKRHWPALAVLALTLILFGFSWLPWFGQHVGEAGTGYHRHCIWQLGHVH